MHRLYAFAVTLLAFPLVHCGFVQQMVPPPNQSLADPSAASAPETTGAGFTPSAGPAAPQAKSALGKPAAAAPQASVPTSVEIHSDCARTTPVFYGEKPKFGSGTRSSIGSNTTTTAGRKFDGTLTVWIIDEQENGIASAHVTPSTRRVEIDRSCRSISAR